MNLLNKVKGACASAAVRFNSKIAALCVFLVALAAQADPAPISFTPLQTAVETNLSGLSTVLMAVAGVIIGIVLVFTGFKLIRRMIG